MSLDHTFGVALRQHSQQSLNEMLSKHRDKAMHNIYFQTIFHARGSGKRSGSQQISFRSVSKSFRPMKTLEAEKTTTENSNTNNNNSQRMNSIYADTHTHMWNALRWSKVETEWKWRLKIWYAKSQARWERKGTAKKETKCWRVLAGATNLESEHGNEYLGTLVVWEVYTPLCPTCISKLN